MADNDPAEMSESRPEAMGENVKLKIFDRVMAGSSYVGAPLKPATYLGIIENEEKFAGWCAVVYDGETTARWAHTVEPAEPQKAGMLCTSASQTEVPMNKPEASAMDSAEVKDAMVSAMLAAEIPGPHSVDPCCNDGDCGKTHPGTCFLRPHQMRVLLAAALAAAEVKCRCFSRKHPFCPKHKINLEGGSAAPVDVVPGPIIDGQQSFSLRPAAAIAAAPPAIEGNEAKVGYRKMTLDERAWEYAKGIRYIGGEVQLAIQSAAVSAYCQGWKDRDSARSAIEATPSPATTDAEVEAMVDELKGIPVLSEDVLTIRKACALLRKLLAERQTQ